MIAGGVTVDIGSPVTLSVVNGVDEATLSSSSLTAGSHVITAVDSGRCPGCSTAPVVNQQYVTERGAPKKKKKKKNLSPAKAEHNDKLASAWRG